jgi:hypothetical protein
MHKYICDRCKKVRGCSIAGCKGECDRTCTKCSREKYKLQLEGKEKSDFEKWSDIILNKGA